MSETDSDLFEFVKEPQKHSSPSTEGEKVDASGLSTEPPISTIHVATSPIQTSQSGLSSLTNAVSSLSNNVQKLHDSIDNLTRSFGLWRSSEHAITPTQLARHIQKPHSSQKSSPSVSEPKLTKFKAEKMRDLPSPRVAKTHTKPIPQTPAPSEAPVKSHEKEMKSKSQLGQNLSTDITESFHYRQGRFQVELFKMLEKPQSSIDSIFYRDFFSIWKNNPKLSLPPVQFMRRARRHHILRGFSTALLLSVPEKFDIDLNTISPQRFSDCVAQVSSSVISLLTAKAFDYNRLSPEILSKIQEAQSTKSCFETLSAVEQFEVIDALLAQKDNSFVNRWGIKRVNWNLTVPTGRMYRRSFDLKDVQGRSVELDVWVVLPHDLVIPLVEKTEATWNMSMADLEQYRKVFERFATPVLKEIVQERLRELDEERSSIGGLVSSS